MKPTMIINPDAMETNQLYTLLKLFEQDYNIKALSNNIQNEPLIIAYIDDPLTITVGYVPETDIKFKNLVSLEVK
jgi:hypothetical protein